MKKPFHSDKNTRDVAKYWDQKPLFDREIASPDPAQYYRQIERLKQEEIEPFSLSFWEFDRHAGEAILDIGCGPGWLSVQYARGGAHVTSLDLSQVSLGRCRAFMEQRGLKDRCVHADCEHLPFPDASFDFISASGVLHHSPEPRAGVQELFRVLKPGGRAAVSVYYRNVLLRPGLLPFVLWTARMFKIRKPDADFGRARDLNELGAFYDGEGNPYGRVYTKDEAMQLFSAFEFDTAKDIEVHYFPRRFLPLGHWIRGGFFRWLDRHLGLMIYFKLKKPQDRGDIN